MNVTARAVRGTVLMDLDGTISDPASGVFAAFRYAVARLGSPWPDDRGLKWIIGPPLRESFAAWLGDEAQAAAALEHYRDHYAAGAMFDNTLYPGMPEAVAALAGRGFRLFVATSKLDEFAAQIVDRFGLAGHFAGVYGASRDGRIEEKAAVIANCLATEKLDPTTCVMVGDRKHDTLGAAAHGVPCIGVAWGYGSVDELRTTGARLICQQPADLPAAVEQMLGHATANAAT